MPYMEILFVLYFLSFHLKASTIIKDLDTRRRKQNYFYFLIRLNNTLSKNTTHTIIIHILCNRVQHKLIQI